ncbi:hypothetical protein [Mycobacterium canetti]|uniref:hypothetical protein n=1 Tax=Mycobacterium canetti TaxID=78331 RepID=UPI0012F7068A|nr:hypothetical protein [Mycobacterium canetti]
MREIFHQQRAAEEEAQRQASIVWRAEKCAQARATINRIRAELAEEFGHDGGEAAQIDSPPASQSLKAVFEGDDPVGQSAAKAHYRFFEMFQAYVTIAAFSGSGSQVADCGDAESAGGHGVGDLVEHGSEHGPGVFGGGVHDASPSLDSDGSLSVGEGRPGSAEHVEPGHAQGGER